MRKIFVFIFLLSLSAAWLIGCGSSGKKIVPPTETAAFAFMQEAGSGTYLFSPMLGTFSTSGANTTFSSTAVLDNSSNQPIVAAFASIYLSADGKMATLDLYGGLDGTSNQWDIWVARADGSSNPTQVTNDTNDNGLPQFSPDGTRVVFNSYRAMQEGGNPIPAVVTRKIDGSDEQVLALPASTQWTMSPTYSPDGSKIAVEMYGFDSESQMYYDGIWVMNATDGSNPIMLTDIWPYCDCFDEDPAYTPDGSKIVFSRNLYDTTTATFSEDIYIMNADGTGVTQLTSNGALNVDPLVVSVAGTAKILFSSNQTNPSDTSGASFELYSMNLDGTNATRLTSNPVYDGFNEEWDGWGDVAAATRATTRHGQRPVHRFSAHQNPGHKVGW